MPFWLIEQKTDAYRMDYSLIAMSTAVYLRVSSENQKTDSQPVEIEKWLQFQ